MSGVVAAAQAGLLHLRGVTPPIKPKPPEAPEPKAAAKRKGPKRR